jgi:glycosyltransferase involved in cell wall biosynthesis
MQGSIPPYYNAYFPSGYSFLDYVLYNGLRLKKTFNNWLHYREFRLRAKREETILRNCHFYMGRTEWDKLLTKLYSPNSDYFYCSEALRDSFFIDDLIWEQKKRTKVVFLTTISPPLYKGVDLILKTAKLLKENSIIEFEWRVFGIREMIFHEWKTKIKASNVNVKLRGTVSGNQLREELLDADIFIHPSYIDNSPNSVCEAQLLGLPVISTNVGGISSLIKHRESGLLVPANDPYTLSSYIALIINEKEFSQSLGSKAREVALKRHDPGSILTDLTNVYKKVIEHSA